MALPDFVDPIVLPASALAAGLADAALFASTDEARPALRYIELAVEESGLLLRATDSYALVERRVEPDTLFPGLPPEPTVVGMLHRDEVALLVKLLKAERKSEADIVPGHDLSVSVRVRGRRVDTEALKEPLTLPSFDSLWPEKAKATTAIEIAGWQLARLGKLSEGKFKPLWLDLHGKAAAVSWRVGELCRGLVMPIGTPGADGAEQPD